MTHQPVTPQKGTILIVDDNPANLRLLYQMLVKQAYKVRVANSGAQAIKSVQRNPPDLILLDLIMPEMDGYEVCQYLQAGEASRHIPVIFISALDATEDKVKAFAIGGVDYVTKPFQTEEVLARVKTHLALREARRKLEKKTIQLEREISIRKRAEEALRQHAAELTASNEELEAFAHTVAHDIKNPLGFIIGYAELAEELCATLPDKTIRYYLHQVVQASYKTNNIIDELLLLASVHRMEEIEMWPLDMQGIVTECLQRLPHLIEKSQAEIITPQSWPAALGYGPWIKEVWVNYVSNAIKYGGQPPRVELGAERADTSSAGGTVRFWIRDNGEGLTPDEQKRLFTPFTRLLRVGTKGHGLGLSIVRRIINKLGGQVGVESEKGQGSTFYFTLPGIEN